MNLSAFIRPVILGLITLGLLMAVWFSLVTHSFLQLKLNSDTGRVTITNGRTGQIIINRTSSGWVNVPTGDYVVAFLAGGKALSIQPKRVGPFSFQTISPTSASTAQVSRPFLKYGADLMTPLGNGYVYLDKSTRGLSHLGNDGVITDLTSRLELTSDINASLAISEGTISNAVVGVAPLSKGGVVVTTTKGVFWIRSITDITRLPFQDIEDHNYTSSAYDAATNSLFVLSSYSSNIYRYKLDNVGQKPEQFFTNTHQFNRLTAGGGKLVAYYDAVVSTDPQVLAEYGRTRQLTPLVIDTSSAKIIKKLEGYEPATYVSVSGNGQYLALKRKFAATLTMYNLSSNRAVSLPAFDLAGATWQGTTFFIARDKALWSYKPDAADAALTRLADTTAPVTWLQAAGGKTIFITNDNTTYLLQTPGAQPPALITPPAPNANIRNLYYAPPFEKQ